MASAYLYGNVTLFRVVCPNCNEASFVDKDGTTTCCGRRICIDLESVRSTRISESYWKRRKPSKKQQEELLELQNYKCIYCGCDLGWESRINFDHFVPWTWSACNSDENFVASCSLCNRLKHDKLFNSVPDARKAIKKRRIERNRK